MINTDQRICHFYHSKTKLFSLGNIYSPPESLVFFTLNFVCFFLQTEDVLVCCVFSIRAKNICSSYLLDLKFIPVPCFTSRVMIFVVQKTIESQNAYEYHKCADFPVL